MVRWSDVQHAAQKSAELEGLEEDDLPPLISHEPVLTVDTWIPEETQAETLQKPEPEAARDPSRSSSEEEEEDEILQEILEAEENDEDEEVFDQDVPEDPQWPVPEGLPDGPWPVGDVEFFSAFDSGNLAGAQLARPQAAPEATSKKDLRSADVQWAAELEDGKILYQMLHNCSVRKEPHPKAKLLTKKSAGARLYASCRVTLGGWQKLVDEDGWAQLGPSTASAETEGTEPELKRFEPVQMATTGFTEDAKTGGYPTAPVMAAMDIQSDVLCFEVTARADCAGTPFASEECQWFHFGLRGQLPKTKLRFHVLGLSRFRRLQTTRLVSGQLLTDGLQPVFRYGDQHEWQLVTGEIGMIRMPDGMIAFTFEHTMTCNLEKDQELYFALTFPYPLGRIYSQLQNLIPRLVQNGVYVNREELTKSLGGHPIELLSLTARSKRSAQRLPRLPELTKEEEDRPWIFEGRRPIFISARVHPGETPASYMLEGLLEFLASNCAAAKELLRRYVFLVVPVLNPDGVCLGHHRLDLRGENLNRVYGKATLEHQPSIFAAEAACLNAHEHQGGLRLYLDLHAHSNRRGGFLLGDSGTSSEARLYGWALGRQCGTFEYSQSDFSESKKGTGKSFMAKATGNPLCFTVECHYIRGHHSPYPFGPSAWRHMGASCLLALLELDFLAKPRLSLCSSLSVFQQRQREGLWALRILEGRRSTKEGSPLKAAQITGPSRARPHFVEILGPSDSHELPRQLRMHPELIGEVVEVINSSCDGEQTWLQLHESFGALRLRECDVRRRQEQHGVFFYGALSKVALSKDVSPSSSPVCFLNPGTILEISERQVVDGVLRLRVRRDSMRGMAEGWVSEFKRPCFDPRLGGAAQLLRLRGRPSSLGKKGPCYAFAC